MILTINIYHQCVALRPRFAPLTLVKINFSLNTSTHTENVSFVSKGSSICLLCIIVKSFVCKKNLQAVKELYEIVPSLKWEKEEKRINKIVFIGNLIYFF